MQPDVGSRGRTFLLGASCSSWTFPQTQDDRRPAAPPRQHRRLPLRLPHLPHLLAGPAALEEEVRTAVNVNVRRSHAGLRIWGSCHGGGTQNIRLRVNSSVAMLD